MTKYIFEDEEVTFYVPDKTGDGIVSQNLVFVGKFKKNKMIWNRGYRPEKINRDFLKSLI